MIHIIFEIILEQHLAMNRARLITNEQSPSEIQANMETRPKPLRTQDSCIKDHVRSDAGGQLWQGRQGGQERKRCWKERQERRSTSEPKSESKLQRVDSWHCGEEGHLSTECLSNPKNQSSTSGIQHKGGKGKTKNVTGKGAGLLEQGDQAPVAEPQPQPALASSLYLSIETLIIAQHIDQEC